jgi:alkylation response protein AidB-like acyl-CoA dehydrogenase
MSESTKQEESELLLDTSKMSDDERRTFEVAEAAREKTSTQPSFLRNVFLGDFDEKLLYPFPKQNLEERKIGDQICEQVIMLLGEHLDPDEVDETRTIPEALIKKMAEMGLFAMKVPKEYGGLGLSQVNYNRVNMAIASYCGSTAVLISAHQSIGVPQPLNLFGTEQQKKKYLPRFREGAISAFALTEPEVGSDPAKMGLEAKLSADGKDYILNGEKLWCTNGPIADLLIVMAKTEPKMVNGKERPQISAFIVEGNYPGIETVHRCDFMGLRGIQNGLMRFKDVKVPAENLLWEKGRGLALALRTLNTGRLTIPAACSGMAKQCLSIARRWAKERVQWGKAIGEHECGADKIAFIASTGFAVEAVTWLTSHWADEGRTDIRMEAAMAKLFTSEAGWQIVDQTLQLRGGRGYERARSLIDRGEVGYPVERMMRDSRINTIIEGTSDIMRLFLAREALDPHLKRAEGLLSKKSNLLTKLKTGGSLLGFYSMWYPSQWLKALGSKDYSQMGTLAPQYKYLEKTSHRLARCFFGKMLSYGPGLDKKQLILGHLVDIGCEILAMGAACSYARSLEETRDQDPIDLANYFCKLSKKRIEEHFAALKDEKTESAKAISHRVLEGKLKWQEEGILGIGPDAT